MLDVKCCAKQVEQNLSYLTSSPTLMSCTNMVPGAALMSCVIKKNFQPLHLCTCAVLSLFCLYLISAHKVFGSSQFTSLLSPTESWGLWTHVASHAACNIILIRHRLLNSHLSLCYYCKQANNTNKFRETQHKELGLPTTSHVDEAMKQEA